MVDDLEKVDQHLSDPAAFRDYMEAPEESYLLMRDEVLVGLEAVRNQLCELIHTHRQWGKSDLLVPFTTFRNQLDELLQTIENTPPFEDETKALHQEEATILLRCDRAIFAQLERMLDALESMAMEGPAMAANALAALKGQLEERNVLVRKTAHK
jgi:hypothetical protein